MKQNELSLLELVSENVLFAGIAPPDIGKLIEYSRILEFAADTTIIGETCFVDGLCLLVEGRAAVFKGTAPERRLTELSKGDFFGEISLFGPTLTATATVRAATPCTILQISRSQINLWFGSFPESETRFFRNLCFELCQRLEQTSERFSSLVTSTAAAR